jgi:hypothetical protein
MASTPNLGLNGPTMALRARLLDFLLHIGLIGSSVAAALLGYGPIPSTTGMLLTTAAIVILLPFRGAWGHYLAGGVDVASAVLAAYVLVQAIQVKPPTTTVMAVEIMSVAYVIIALVAASVIERNRHGRMELRRAFLERHLSV